MRALAAIVVFIGLWSNGFAQGSENIDFGNYVPRITSSQELASLHLFSFEEAEDYPHIRSELFLDNKLLSSVYYENTKSKSRSDKLLITSERHDSTLCGYLNTLETLPPGRWKQKVHLYNEADTLWNERSYTLHNFELIDSLLLFQHVWVVRNRVHFSVSAHDTSQHISLTGKGLRLRDSTYSIPIHGQIHFSVEQMGFLISDERIEANRLVRQSISVNSALEAAGLASGTGIQTQPDKIDLLKNPIIRPSVGIETEVNVSDIDTLYGLLPANYYRVRLSPKLTVVGIPLQSDLYYTSESGFGYQMNTINLQMDRQALEESLREKAKTQQRAYQLRTLELNYKERLAQEQQQLQQAALQKCVEAGEQAQQRLLDSLDQLETQLKTRAQDSLQSSSDSLGRDLQQQRDSLQALYLQRVESYSKTRDSLNAEVQKAQKGYQQIVDQKAAIEKRIAEIKALKNGGFQSPELLDSAAFINSTEKILLSIENLQIGRHYLQTEPSGLGGIPVDGLSFDYRHKWVSVGFSNARFSPQNLLFDQTLANENTYRLKRAAVGVGAQDKQYFEAQLLHMSHRAGAELNNVVTSLNYSNQTSERLFVQAHLSLSEHYLAGTSPGLGTNSVADGNYRFTLETEANLYKEVLTAEYFHSETGLNYATIASPFLRSNLRRQQVQLNLRPSSVLSFELYRKTETSIDEAVSSFQMTGYGFSGTCTGKNGLLLTTSYMPFNYEVDIINFQKMARTRSGVLLLSAFQRFRKHTLGIQATQMNYTYSELARSGRYRNYALVWQSTAIRNLSLQTQLGINELKQETAPQLSTAWNASGLYDISGKLNGTLSLSRQANLLTGAQQSRAGIGLQIELFGFTTGVEGGYMQMPVHFESTEMQEGFYFNLGLRNSIF